MNSQSAKPEPVEGPEIEALRTALDTMPEHYRTPLTLYYFGGLNQNETAEALGSPLGTVAKQLARGLEHLREKLGRAGFAVTSAGLLAMFASIPSYAASPEFKAGLVASRRLVVPRHGGDNLLHAKGISQGAALMKVGVVAALVAGAAIFAYAISPEKTAPKAVISQPAASEAGLIAHWTFDDGQGPTAKSRVGNDLGILVDGPAWTPGKIGGALKFDGFDDYVLVSNSSALNTMKEQMTVAAWIFKSPGTVDYESVIGRRHGDRFSDVWTILYNMGNVNHYGFSVFTESGEYSAIGPTSTDDLNTWVHLAGTYDGTSVCFYRNGILAGTIPGTGPLVSDTTPVIIGATDAGTFGMSEYLIGAIDDVRLYNRALSAAEIAELAR